MAQSAPSLEQWVRSHYQRPKGFDERLFNQFIGVEILRRLIGIAQLPLSLSIAEKQKLIEEAVALLKG